MTNIRPYFVSGAKFNRPCGLGFAVEDLLSPEDAQTLGLIISESICFIFEPKLLQLSEALHIQDEDKLTLGDLGCLVHAEVSKAHGTRIAVAIPSWMQEVEKGIFFSFKLVLSQSMKEFSGTYVDNAAWIFPITVNDARFIKQIEDHLGFPLDYSMGWILADGYSKLRRYRLEYESSPEKLKNRFSQEYSFIQHLMKSIEAVQDPSTLFQSQKDLLITTIGNKARTIKEASQ